MIMRGGMGGGGNDKNQQPWGKEKGKHKTDLVKKKSSSIERTKKKGSFGTGKKKKISLLATRKSRIRRGKGK